MNYAGIIFSDIADSDDGECTSLWFNGYDVKCKGCHNKSLWDEVCYKDNEEVVDNLYTALTKGPNKKSLSILGGEPLMVSNRKDCLDIIRKIKQKIPDLYIRVWTGHIYEQLLAENDPTLNEIFQTIDCLIDGPFDESKTVIGTLNLRGSSNQRVILLKQLNNL